MSRAGVNGPLFISLGQPDQLQKFLEINPELKDAKALIDTSPTFEGYLAAGFGSKIGDIEVEDPLKAMKPPKEMSMGKWFAYLRNVGGLSPVPKDFAKTAKFGDVPEGVKILGGTFAIDGDEVKFSHSDPIPGATPEIEAVLASVGA